MLLSKFQLTACQLHNLKWWGQGLFHYGLKPGHVEWGLKRERKRMGFDWWMVWKWVSWCVSSTVVNVSPSTCPLSLRDSHVSQPFLKTTNDIVSMVCANNASPSNPTTPPPLLFFFFTNDTIIESLFKVEWCIWMMSSEREQWVEQMRDQNKYPKRYYVWRLAAMQLWKGKCEMIIIC